MAGGGAKSGGNAQRDSGRAIAAAWMLRQAKRGGGAQHGNGRRCSNGHEKYNNQLAKAAMDGATAMDGDGRRNRATAMAAMEDRR